jgi:hypothetical protein
VLTSPIDMYHTLEDPDYASQVAQWRRCAGGFLPPIIVKLLEHFPSEAALRSEDCVMTLQLLLLLGKTDNVPIEVGNASIRRDIVFHSTQTIGRSMEDVGCSHVFRMARRRLRGTAWSIVDGKMHQRKRKGKDDAATGARSF